MELIIWLLFAVVIMQQKVIEDLKKDINVLKNNEEVLRKGINELNKKIE